MPETKTETSYVYEFSEGSREMRELLGGKGANIAEMTRVLGAERVPAGFTITTAACVAYMESEAGEVPGLDSQVDSALAALEQNTGKQLGDHRATEERHDRSRDGLDPRVPAWPPRTTVRNSLPPVR